MGTIVKCPQCNEINFGSQLHCVKCQTSLIGIPREQGESPVPEFVSSPPPPPRENYYSKPLEFKEKKNLWAIAGIVIAVICICLALVGTGVGKIMVERAPIESILDTFMKDMVAKDIESAYALFSPRVQRQIPIDDIQKMIDGNNYILFDGYKNLSVQNLNLTATANTNPDLPQGTVANVNGFIEYSDGFTGNFTAILEKVDG
ncbi:MAG TPA: hypothetical protein PLT08_18205, partial [Anaerolineales bacterium]|nr:hypothetical protein [Anaerolineales bacterium]